MNLEENSRFASWLDFHFSFGFETLEFKILTSREPTLYACIERLHLFRILFTPHLLIYHFTFHFSFQSFGDIVVCLFVVLQAVYSVQKL